MVASPPGPHRGRRSNSTCKAAELAIDFLRVLDSPVARSVRRALKTGDYASVVNASISPDGYDCLDRFYRDYMAVSLMRKYPGFPLGIDTAQVALDSFKSSEAACAQINEKLNADYDTPTTRWSGDSLLETARRKIAWLLGDFSWDEAESFFAFTSGASYRLPRKRGDAYYKFQGKPEVTHLCAMPALVAIWRTPSWRARLERDYGPDPENWIEIVPGNRIATVPKNAKTDRTIAIEPSLNMYLQAGIGGVIRKRLRRVGIDLDDQSRNQRAAMRGSAEDGLCTIDLKAASDSISLQLVRRLLPPSWWDAIYRTRSPLGRLPDGTWVTYQKVSSMGNGYTFELESLIFWALCSAVLESSGRQDVELLVYGDDIVVPKYAAGFCIELLSYVGFETNLEKTFCNGPFRESCGKHYFRGVDVTPFYIDEPISDVLDLFWYANSVRRWAGRQTQSICDPRFRAHWNKAVSMLPPKYRDPVLPDGVGDGGLIGCFDEVRPRFRRHGKLSGFIYRSLSYDINRKRLNGAPAVLRALMYRGTWDADDVLDFGQRVARGMLDARPETLYANRPGRGSCLEFLTSGGKKGYKIRTSDRSVPQWQDPAVWP